MPLGDDGVHVRDYVFADILAEFQNPLIGLLHRVDFDEEDVSAAKHIGHDAGRSRTLHRIVFVKDELGVAGPDVQNSYVAHATLRFMRSSM